jgi:hypothetical protein
MGIDGENAVGEVGVAADVDKDAVEKDVADEVDVVDVEDVERDVEDDVGTFGISRRIGLGGGIPLPALISIPTNE